jgi:hypothetical protein
MSDDEIIQLAGSIFNKGNNTEAITFARAIESRTLIKTKAEWYLLGAEDERRACAAIVDAEIKDWDNITVDVALTYVAAEIRARGE